MRLALWAVLAAGAWAHDLEALADTAGRAVVVRALYAGTEPVPFVQVQVYSPAKPDAEFQSGRADARGWFAFVPDRDGAWRVVVDDETGHRKELQLTVVAGQVSGSGGGVPAWQKAVTGVSILVGFTGIALWWRVRGAAKNTPPT
jgi:nickel transport protein